MSLSNFVEANGPRSASGASGASDSFDPDGHNSKTSAAGWGDFKCSNWDSFLVAMFIIALVVLIFAIVMFSENYQDSCIVGSHIEKFGEESGVVADAGSGLPTTDTQKTADELSKKATDGAFGGDNQPSGDVEVNGKTHQLVEAKEVGAQSEETIKSTTSEVKEAKDVAAEAGAVGPATAQSEPPSVAVTTSPAVTKLHVESAEVNAKVAENNVVAAKTVAASIPAKLAAGDEAGAATAAKALEIIKTSTQEVAKKAAKDATSAVTTSNAVQQTAVVVAKQAAVKAKSAAAVVEQIEKVTKVTVQKTHPNLCPAWTANALAEKEMIAKLNGHDDNDFDVPRTNRSMQSKMDESYLEGILRGMDNFR